MSVWALSIHWLRNTRAACGLGRQAPLGTRAMSRHMKRVTCPRCIARMPTKIESLRAYSQAVQKYMAAQEVYRKFSNKNRPPRVSAAYEAAGKLLDRLKEEGESPREEE